MEGTCLEYSSITMLISDEVVLFCLALPCPFHAGCWLGEKNNKDWRAMPPCPCQTGQKSDLIARVEQAEWFSGCDHSNRIR